ncbi:MAG: hypothetical protein QG656_868 [Candidatus Hydrogenedentes bacterium]|nr:hypothetical protein [Candidatus Hydrogenedentota bacterium]
MRQRLNHVLFGVLLSAMLCGGAYPCTTFCIEHGGRVVFGKNYDWSADDGFVFVNKRNVHKTALAMVSAADKRAEWTSKYGSVTFNQYGRELPNGGMNEVGLVVEVMWLSDTEHAPFDDQPAINNLQWVQYQLDNFGTVDQVLQEAVKLRIMNDSPAKIHYLVGDSLGNAASFEVLGGKWVCHNGDTMPVKALTNDTYASSVEAMKGYKGLGGDLPLPQGRDSLARFIRASSMVKGYGPKNLAPPVQYAFSILDNAAQGDQTKWRIVYDLKARHIHFKTLRAPETREISLKGLDFSCSTPVLLMDMNEDVSGNATGLFQPYTPEANRALIGTSFGKIDFLGSFPPKQLDMLALYPDSTRCGD